MLCYAISYTSLAEASKSVKIVNLHIGMNEEMNENIEYKIGVSYED